MPESFQTVTKSDISIELSDITLEDFVFLTRFIGSQTEYKNVFSFVFRSTLWHLRILKKAQKPLLLMMYKARLQRRLPVLIWIAMVHQ